MIQRKLLFPAIFLSMFIAQGCGSGNTGQTLHESDADILASITPTPIVSMQPEQIQIDFSHYKGSIGSVSVQFSMPDMTMAEKVNLSPLDSGKYQGNYRFSMSGKWVETITYQINGKPETATVNWDVKD